MTPFGREGDYLERAELRVIFPYLDVGWLQRQVL